MVFADGAVVRGVVKNIGCDFFDARLNCRDSEMLVRISSGGQFKDIRVDAQGVIWSQWCAFSSRG